MKRFPSPSMVVAIAALCAALAGGAYAATKIGTKQLVKKERSQGFVFFDGAEVPLPAGTSTAVAQLRLPKGNYFVTAAAGLDAVGQRSVECQIRDDGSPVARAESALPVSGGSFSGHLTLTGPVNAGVITLDCAADADSTARHRMITAVRIGTLFSQ